MNKTELAATIASQTNLTKAQADEAVTAAIDIIRTTVAAGGQVTLPGIGVFEATYREARTGRHPQTGEPMEIPGSWGPKFKTFDSFKAVVRDGRSLVSA